MGNSEEAGFEMAVYPGSIIRCSAKELRDAVDADMQGNWCFSGATVDEDLAAPIYISELMRSVKLVSRPLTYGVEKHIAAFKSHNTYLLDFLRMDAMKLEEKGNTCTTLFFDKDSDTLVAFCSTKCSTVKVKGISVIPALRPTVEIALLCVDDRYRYKGIGQTILGYVLTEVKKIRQKVGIELITLFAIPAAVEFYKKNNFKELKGGVKIFHAPVHQKCTPMYLTLPPKRIGSLPIT